MRAVCPYVRLHPLTVTALQSYAPAYVLHELGPQPDAYYTFLAQMWEGGDGWLNVEQDIEIHDRVLGEAASCPEPLCVWPYAVGSPGNLVYGALGCTRFSSELLRRHPSLIRELSVRRWEILDAEIHPRLLALGVQPHHHYPTVKHHHIYSGWCACDEVHE